MRTCKDATDKRGIDLRSEESAAQAWTTVLLSLLLTFAHFGAGGNLGCINDRSAVTGLVRQLLGLFRRPSPHRSIARPVSETPRSLTPVYRTRPGDRSDSKS